MNKGESRPTVERVGDWRYCPACGGPIKKHVVGISQHIYEDKYGEFITEVDIEENSIDGLEWQDIYCEDCDRPWTACPCDLRRQEEIDKIK